MIGSNQYRARRAALIGEAIDALGAERGALPPHGDAGLEVCLRWLAAHREPEWSRVCALASAETVQDELAVETLLGPGAAGR